MELNSGELKEEFIKIVNYVDNLKIANKESTR